MISSKRRFYLLPILWGLFIVYMSLLPGGTGMFTWMGIPHVDKVLHAGAYALLAFLWGWASFRTHGDLAARIWWIALACIIIGCLLEVGQYFLRAGRSFDIGDMMANAVGAALGSGMGRRVLFRKK